MSFVGTFRISLSTTDATAASVTINPTGAKNAITYTARTPGTAGNGITVAYVDPAGNDQTIAVSVSTLAISVSLATDGGGLITSTAAAIRTAIAAHAGANALVTTALSTADAGNDGSGVVTAVSATPLTGGTAASSGGTYYLDGKRLGDRTQPVKEYEIRSGDLLELKATLGTSRNFSEPSERSGIPVQDYS